MDNSLVLFTTKTGSSVTYGDYVDALKKIVMEPCEILFIHTSMNFGIPNRFLKRRELMEAMYAGIKELGIKTLIFPTFTFSFCNNEDYDVMNSKCKMGMLNEYVRKLPEAKRSMDPLLSVCVIGENMKLAVAPKRFSIGKDSIFDKLHHSSNVQFLFLGMPFGDCFTYMHYVEQCCDVPYRYNRIFSGNVINEEGEKKTVEYELYVRYKGVVPIVPGDLEQDFLENGIMKKCILGDGIVSCISEKEAFDNISRRICQDNFCFSKEHYEDTSSLEKEYQYGNVVSL